MIGLSVTTRKAASNNISFSENNSVVTHTSSLAQYFVRSRGNIKLNVNYENNQQRVRFSKERETEAISEIKPINTLFSDGSHGSGLFGTNQSNLHRISEEDKGLATAPKEQDQRETDQ